jgi:hypothetical protein
MKLASPRKYLLGSVAGPAGPVGGLAPPSSENSRPIPSREKLSVANFSCGRTGFSLRHPLGPQKFMTPLVSDWS